MRTLFSDIRNYIAVVATFLFLFHTNLAVYSQQASEFGDFPYEQSLKNGQPSEVSLPSAQGALPNKAKFIQNHGLELTPNEYTSFGAAFINNRQFTSKNGIRVEFEYMVYGSSGSGGDGITMFLFDASITPTIGANGAGLGYCYNRTTPSYDSQRMAGLKGGYLGVALDEFGNYKGLRYQKNSRVNGIPFGMAIRGSKDMGYNTANQVTLRGARGVKLKPDRLDEGFTGYPVLITQSTNNTDNVKNTDDRPGFVINPTNGEYNLITDYKGSLFTIAGKSTFNDNETSNPAYRKAIIELLPVPEHIDPNKGFLVTVKIQHGNVLETVINDYHYIEKIHYQENSLPEPSSGDGSNGDYNTTSTLRFNPLSTDLNTKVPDKLRIGFAASTGEEKNYHVIKNLRIMLPRSAEAYDDSTEIYTHQTAVITPYENDLAYEGIIRRIQTGDKNNIDPLAFRFIDNGTILSLGSGETVIEYTNSQGIWKYDSSNGQVTFKPANGFKDRAVIEYDIKGKKDDSHNAGPYHDEAYRSVRASIIVNVLENPVPLQTKIVTNKMATSKPRKKP